MAFVLNKNTEIGENILPKAEDAIFGMVIFNDWATRDIQSWEYVPAFAFLGKISVPLFHLGGDFKTLEPFRTASPKQEPEV